MVAMSNQLRTVLLAEAERARNAVNADCAAISRWEHDKDLMRTLVNVGALLPGDERLPEDEVYPLDSFPAVAALLRDGTPYLNPDDVSSVALSAHHRYFSHAAVPITIDGECWGELWVSRKQRDAAMLAPQDLERLRLVAERLADALAPLV
jgi:GAF domain-containing protein